MRGGKCRSLNSIIYGIINLVRFILIYFEVTYHNISSKGCVCATNFYSLPTATLFVVYLGRAEG